jgi:hypothetical protein
MKIFNFAILFLMAWPCAEASTKVRRVQMQSDQIATVQTALGIATIIQVPDRPNSVVVGDAEAFKVEYLDQAITIKPLRFGAKSNLYVYTDYRRFNVQLVIGPENSSDYVVYLENAKEKVKPTKPTLVWMPYKNHLRNDALTLEIKRLGRTRDNVLVVEFLIRGMKKESLKPDSIWLTQGSATRPIHNLFLSGLEVRPGQNVEGLMQVLLTDVDTTEPLRLELRRIKNSYITIPKVQSWK